MAINGDNGSNYHFDEHLVKGTPQHSGFNLSYVNSFTMEEGKMYPSFFEYTVFGDTGTIKQTSLVRVLNTPVVPLASRQRIFFHTYYSPLGSLWAEAETFFTKGRTVADAKTLSDATVPKVSLAYTCFARGKLMDMLGFVNVPQDGSIERVEVPIFKPMMYLRLMRDNYINQRIHATWLEWKEQNKDDSDLVDYGFIKKWFYPADDHEFRWNSKVHDLWLATMEDDEDGEDIVNATYDYLFGDLWYRYWTDDYFTTAQLTPIYGEVPYFASTLEGTFQELLRTGESFSAVDRYLVFGNSTVDGVSSSILGSTDKKFNLSTEEGSANWTVKLNSSKHLFADNPNTGAGINLDNFNLKTTETFSNNSRKDFVTAMNNTMKIVGSTDLTLDSLRNLACATAILQKLAHTDGSYKEYGLTYFGVKPRLAQDMKAQYIGGSYQPINFSEVINVGDNQGDISGRGVAGGKDSIGHYFADDYGIIMTLANIMPDTYYSQGWHKQDLFETSDDFYVPERAALGMEAILNAEIFKSFDEYDRVVFGYQNRCDFMRYRYNEVHGKVADDNNESYSPYIEQRYFESCPTLTPSFLSTEGTIAGKWRTDKTDGVSYFIQVLNDHMATRPLPYKTEPNNLGF